MIYVLYIWLVIGLWGAILIWRNSKFWEELVNKVSTDLNQEPSMAAVVVAKIIVSLIILCSGPLGYILVKDI